MNTQKREGKPLFCEGCGRKIRAGEEVGETYAIQGYCHHYCEKCAEKRNDIWAFHTLGADGDFD